MNAANGVPVVLPVVRVHVEDTGALSVELAGVPYAAERTLQRSDLRDLITEIAGDLRSAVRIEVIEADGTTYTDIELPPDTSAKACADEPAGEVSTPGIGGSGFRPGEPVALAYVLLEQTADDTGHAAVRLPPSVLRRRRGSMLLVGLESRVTALVEATA